MHDEVFLVVWRSHVGQIQRANRVERLDDRGFHFGAAIRSMQGLPYLPERPEHASPIEALPLAMVAEAHA